MRNKTVDNLMGFWKDSTEAIIRNRKHFSERTVVLLFSDLVSRTEAVMRCLCDRIDLPFERTLLSPTFNGIPIHPNTSHESLKGRGGVVPATLDVFQEVLADEEIDRVRREFEPIYEAAMPSVSVTEDTVR